MRKQSEGGRGGAVCATRIPQHCTIWRCAPRSPGSSGVWRSIHYLIRPSLVDIFSLYEEGSRVFGDPRVLTPKLERFIGSILSIANMYFNHPTKTKVIETDLYLPTIDGIHTEETLYVVISRNAHYMLDQIRANAHDFAEIKKAYANIGGLTRRGYVELLMKFSSRALKRDLPARIERQVKALR